MQNIATHKSASLCGGSRSDLGFAGCQANDDEEEYDDDEEEEYDDDEDDHDDYDDIVDDDNNDNHAVQIQACCWLPGWPGKAISELASKQTIMHAVADC